MKPKLIVLNGNPGMGKSTLAQRYVDERPMSLKLDIDRLWHMMGCWQAELPRSGIQKRRLAYAIADMHLADGFDVIVADHIQDSKVYEVFEKIAIVNGALFKEITLLSNVEDAIDRCKSRAVKLDYSDGFRPGGVLDTNGRELMLQDMHSGMLAAIATRQNNICIDSVNGDIDGTYLKLIEAIS